MSNCQLPLRKMTAAGQVPVGHCQRRPQEVEAIAFCRRKKRGPAVHTGDIWQSKCTATDTSCRHWQWNMIKQHFGDGTEQSWKDRSYKPV